MGSFFHLGFDRRCLVAAFAALAFSCFAVDSSSWTDGDVTYLLNLADDIQANTYATDQRLLEISDDVSAIKFFLDRIDDKSVDINDNLVAISNLLRKLTFDNVSQLRVTDTGVLQVANSIDSKIDRLEQSINNLTNFLCYSPAYASEWTNISSIVNALIKNQSGFYEEDVVYYLTDILGRPPTSEEISRATDIVQYYGAYSREVLSNISRLSFNHLPSGSWHSFWQRYISGIFNVSIATEAQNLGELYFYQYGTRILTDSFLQFTNEVLPYLDRRFITSSVSVQSDDEESIPYAFSETSASVASCLSSSAVSTFSITDDLTEPATNPISPIANSGYQHQMDIALNSQPDSGLGAIADDLNDYLNQHSSGFEELTGVSSGDYTFEFDVPVEGLESGTTRRYEMKVPNTSTRSRPILHFICSVLKIALSIYFAYYVWDKVVLDLWKY